MPSLIDLLLFGLGAGIGVGVGYFGAEFAYDTLRDWLDDRGVDDGDEDAPGRPIHDTTADDPSVRRDKPFVAEQGSGYTYVVCGQLVHRAACEEARKTEKTGIYGFESIPTAFVKLIRDRGYTSADCCKPFAAIEEVA